MSLFQYLDGEGLVISRRDQSSMWDGYHFGRMRNISEYRNDFHSITLAEWVITESGAGTQTISDADNGILLLTNAAADDNSISMQLGNTADGGAGESFLPTAGRNIWFECRAAISDATQSDWLCGLVVTDTTPLANANGIYFRKDDGDTQIDFETNASSIASTSSNIFTMNTGFITYGFKVTGTNLVEAYINDVLVARHTTQIPTTELRLTFHIQNGEGVAKSAQIDYVHVAQHRFT